MINRTIDTFRVPIINYKSNKRYNENLEQFMKAVMDETKVNEENDVNNMKE